MKRFDSSKWITENKYGKLAGLKPLYTLNENKNHDLDFLERLPVGESVTVGVIIKGKYRKRNGGMYDEEDLNPDEYKKVTDTLFMKNEDENSLIKTKELSELINNNNAIEDRFNRSTTSISEEEAPVPFILDSKTIENLKHLTNFRGDEKIEELTGLANYILESPSPTFEKK